MKRFFKIFLLSLPMIALCSEAAWACRPKFYNSVTGTYMEWNGKFDDKAIFQWNLTPFSPINPPVPCSENSKPMQLQNAPVIHLKADSIRGALYAYVYKFNNNNSDKRPAVFYSRWKYVAPLTT